MWGRRSGARTIAARAYNPVVSTPIEELIRICEALPAEKRGELVEFAKCLLDRNGDEQWERIIASPEPRRKLEAYVQASLAEGSEPLDPEQL